MKPRSKQVDPYQKITDWSTEAEKLLEIEKSKMTQIEKKVLTACQNTLDIMHSCVGENKRAYRSHLGDMQKIIKNKLEHIEHSGVARFLDDLQKALPTLDKAATLKKSENKQPSARKRSGAVTSGMFGSNEFRREQREREADEILGIDSKSGKFSERQLRSMPRKFSGKI